MTDFSTEGLRDDFPLTAETRRRLARVSIFGNAAYLRLNPDVAQAGFDATLHAMHHGVQEGRELFSETEIAHAYGSAARDLSRATASEVTNVNLHPDHPPRVTVFVHSLSDLRTRDAARGLIRELRQARVSVSLRNETADHLSDHGVMVFVAPQDFFTIGSGVLWWDREILKNGFVYNTASIATVDGRRAFAAILNARGVIEPSPVWARLWAQAEVATLQVDPPVALRSRWLEPSDRLHPLILGAPTSARHDYQTMLPWHDRPLDLLHFDRDTERRNTFFGRHATSFAKHSTYLYLQQGAAGFVEERMHRRAHTRIFGHLATQARLTLNLAESRYPTLDRYKIIHQAIAGGSVVVSDVEFVDASLRSGLHYFHEDSKHIEPLIDWLLLDGDGHRAAERVRQASLDFLSTRNGDQERAARIAAFLTVNKSRH